MMQPVTLQPAAGLGAATRPTAAARGPSTSFAEVLQSQLRPSGGVTFSAHAQQRLESRGVSLSPADQARLQHAVGEASAKGARESLILMDQLAFVVSVPNQTVITVVPPNEMGDAVFTNIDSAVVVGNRPMARHLTEA
jgi:flagellar operon protein